MVLNSDLSQGTASTSWEWPDASNMSTHVMHSILYGDRIGPAATNKVVGLLSTNEETLRSILKAMQNAPRPMGQIESQETAILFTNDDQECARRWIFACNLVS